MTKLSTSSASKPTWFNRALSWLSDNVAVVLTLSGLALYGGGRVALDAFYHPLGTTASEVGVSYLAIVALAGVSIGSDIVIYITLGVVITACMYALLTVLTLLFRRLLKPAYTYLDYLEERQIEHQPLQMTIGFGILLISLQVFTSWFYALPPGPPEWLHATLTVFILVIAPLVYAFALSFTLAKPLLDPPTSPTNLITDLSSILRSGNIRLFLIALPLMLIGNTLLAAGLQGAEYAAQVRSGHEVQPGAHATVPFQAYCVTLLPTSAQASPASNQLQNRKMLYLGQSSGVTILYQVDVGSIRIPSGSFALRRISGQCRS